MKNFLHHTNLLIRSFVFSIIMVTLTTLYSFVCVLIWPLSLRYRYGLILTWTRFMIFLLKVICYVDYHVEGLENIPKDRSGIVLSKHQSTWETFFLPPLFNEAAIIVKRELLWVPFFGWGLATIDPIAINRSDKASAMEQIITKGKKCLQQGRFILIFPEGTRIPYGKVGHYRTGGARLAKATGYPIIPIAHNAGRYWPKRKFIKTPGTVKIVIGPLIEVNDRSPEAVTAEVKNWIEDTIKKIDQKNISF
ncbi:MAG: hypothetical protein ACD_60C00160G0022 [uncultured bacterium]|nr:MAG: hypothetical protein ACD_60C00160G0022 [uncultured bacterium]